VSRNGEERKVADTRGRFARAVKEGRAVNDVSWTTGRLILSNRRLVLAGADGKRTIPLSEIDDLGGRHDANQAVARVSGYVSLQIGEDVVLVAAEDHGAFETDLYRALLDQRVLLARHPAVEGGVVQDTEWQGARIKIEDDEVDVALKSGTFVELDLDDIGRLETADRTVQGEKREVLEVEHTEGSTSVETYISGGARHVRFLGSLLEEGVERTEAEIDLSEAENEVLMALYSGVSPFEVPNFLGMDVDRVEEIFERLIELDVLEEVRVRREVALKSRGRNIASEAMNEQ